MAKVVIAPHMRLHEWVARDKGYFDREGLDYEFRDQLAATPTGRIHDLGNNVGAYPGERLVFEPYTKEVYEASFAWIAAHGIFPEAEMGAGIYENAILPLPA
jgi:hypothetical protein